MEFKILKFGNKIAYTSGGMDIIVNKKQPDSVEVGDMDVEDVEEFFKDQSRGVQKQMLKGGKIKFKLKEKNNKKDSDTGTDKKVLH